MLYSICGLTVEFEPRYPKLRRRSEKYMITESTKTPDITLEVSERELKEYAKTLSRSSIDNAEYTLYGVDFYSKILDFDGFFLHSSAVALGNEAYLFTAHSGGGKSTHASIWRKIFPDCTAINDDKPAVRRIDGKFYACGTPFSGKHDLNSNVVVPIKGICVIEQASENSIERMPAQKATQILFEQTNRKLSAERTAVLLSLFDELLSEIPIYRLRCNISDDAAYLSYKAMNSLQSD